MPTAFGMCPPLLWTEIIKINHLRWRAAGPEPVSAEDLSNEACGILSRTSGFSPEQWAEPKPSFKEDWVFMGRMYQSAVALYCILSLQSLSVLPATHELITACAAHSQVLWDLLHEGLPSPRLKHFMLWPLVVLGVTAAHGGGAMRAFVAEQLPKLGYDVGTYVPLTAKSVLESFWASGETSWDLCFDKPYAFTMQIAVDVSRILPY